MTPEEQLQRWVNGESVHMGRPKEGQCCPDFSCCNEQMNTPRSEREAFLRGDEAARESMLMTFLGRALTTIGKEVYIAGDPANYEDPQ